MRAIHMPQHQNIQFTPPQPMPTNDNIMTTTENNNNNNNNNNNYDNDEQVNLLSTKGDEQLAALNSDLQNIKERRAEDDDGETTVQMSPPKMKTVVVKHSEVINGGGFFETQVEVIEKEEIIQVPVDQEIKKGDPIFAFQNFNDFRSKYFNKEVDPVQEFTRVRSIQQARAKYSKRFNHQQQQDFS